MVFGDGVAEGHGDVQADQITRKIASFLVLD